MGGVVRSVTKAVKSVVKGVGKVVSGVVSAVTSPFGASTDVPDYDIGQDQTEAIQGVLINDERNDQTFHRQQRSHIEFICTRCPGNCGIRQIQGQIEITIF